MYIKRLEGRNNCPDPRDFLSQPSRCHLDTYRDDIPGQYSTVYYRAGQYATVAADSARAQK